MFRNRRPQRGNDNTTRLGEHLEPRQLLALVAEPIPAHTFSDSAATVGVEISEVDHNEPTVTVYWGDNDGQDVPHEWDHAIALATTTTGRIETRITGLQPATKYYFRIRSSNGIHAAEWTDTKSFTTHPQAAFQISEVMSANASTLPTRIRRSVNVEFAGPLNHYDWLEIENRTDTDLDLGGYYLTDRQQQPDRWQIPHDTIVAAQSSVIVFASGFNVQNPDFDERGLLHTNFSLARTSEYLGLYDPDLRLADDLEDELENQQNDVSVGWVGEHFGDLSQPSPGAPNPRLAPRIHDVSHEVVDQDMSLFQLTVSARVESILGMPIVVEAHLRHMFDAEQTFIMRDDGQHGDEVAGDQIYTTVIAGFALAPGEMFRYYVTANEDTAFGRMPRFLSADKSPQYFGDIRAEVAGLSKLPVFHRFIADPAAGDTSVGTRVSVFYEEEFYDNVFMRIRGASARAYSKKSYKIEFNDGYSFRFREDLPRVDEFNLNTTFTDKSYVRQTLAAEVYAMAGVAGPIIFPMRVEQNGEFFSVAVFVEQPDRDLLRRHQLDPDGAFYKARSDTPNSLSGRVANRFNKKTRHDEDFSDLQSMVENLATEDLDRFLFDQINLPAQISLMAANVLLQNIDATDKNYYIYRDTNGNQEWRMMPWDVDLVLGPDALNVDTVIADDDDGPDHSSHPYLGTIPFSYGGRNNRLLDAVVANSRTRQMFLRRVRTLLDKILQTSDSPRDQRYFESRIDQLVTQLGPDVERDRARWGDLTHFAGETFTLQQAVDRVIHEYLEPRRKHLYERHSIDQHQSSVRQVLIPESFDAAKYFVPTNDNLGTSWKNLDPPDNFNQWRTGPLGIGFERTPRNFTELIRTRVKPSDKCNECSNVLVRIPFSLENPDDISKLTLRMKYDDAFVAYLNGVEVARRNVVDEQPAFNARASSNTNTRAVKFENIDISQFVADIQLSTHNVLAIQAINSSPRSNDMLVVPELIDGLLPDLDAVGIPHQQGPPQVEFGDFDANPVSGNQDQEFIELRNVGSDAFDLTGWKLVGGIQHTFHAGTVILPGESLYVTPSSRAFRDRTVGPQGGMGLFVQDRYRGHLSNFGETVSLASPHGDTVATLRTPAEPSLLQQHLRIAEVYYHPSDDERSEFIELVNTDHGDQGVSLDLTGAQITDGPAQPFTFSEGTQLGPGERILIVKNITAFRQAFPHVDPSMIAGEYEGNLSNGGERLRLDDATRSTIANFIYDDTTPWPESADGQGDAIVPVDLNQPTATFGVAANWRAHKPSPGQADLDRPTGDVTQDHRVDADDIDRLCSAIRDGHVEPLIDVNLDKIVDRQDLDFLILDVLKSRPGDANLDGIFDDRDFTLVFQGGLYEDQIAGNAGWSTGDWNCDGEFDSEDIVTAMTVGNFQLIAAALDAESDRDTRNQTDA